MLDNMIDKATKEKFVCQRKAKDTNKKRARYIKKEIRGKVYKKANGKCENCGSIYALEIDHKINFARMGSNEAENLQLLCKNCNSRKAIRDYGQQKMDLFTTLTCS